MVAENRTSSELAVMIALAARIVHAVIRKGGRVTVFAGRFHNVGKYLRANVIVDRVARLTVGEVSVRWHQVACHLTYAAATRHQIAATPF